MTGIGITNMFLMLALTLILFTTTIIIIVFIVKKIRNAIIKDVTKIATDVAKNIEKDKG